MKQEIKTNLQSFTIGMFLMLILCTIAASFRIGSLENKTKQLERERQDLKDELLDCYRNNKK